MRFPSTQSLTNFATRFQAKTIRAKRLQALAFSGFVGGLSIGLGLWATLGSTPSQAEATYQGSMSLLQTAHSSRSKLHPPAPSPAGEGEPDTCFAHASDRKSLSKGRGI